MSYTKNQLENLSRKELQDIAKNLGIKANLSNAKMIGEILEKNEQPTEVVSLENLSAPGVLESGKEEKVNSITLLNKDDEVKVLKNGVTITVVVKRINKKTVRVAADGEEWTVSEDEIIFTSSNKNADIIETTSMEVEEIGNEPIAASITPVKIPSFPSTPIASVKKMETPVSIRVKQLEEYLSAKKAKDDAEKVKPLAKSWNARHSVAYTHRSSSAPAVRRNSVAAGKSPNFQKVHAKMFSNSRPITVVVKKDIAVETKLTNALKSASDGIFGKNTFGSVDTVKKPAVVSTALAKPSSFVPFKARPMPNFKRVHSKLSRNAPNEKEAVSSTKNMITTVANKENTANIEPPFSVLGTPGTPMGCVTKKRGGAVRHFSTSTFASAQKSFRTSVSSCILTPRDEKKAETVRTFIDAGKSKRQASFDKCRV